jgi:FkbM family methyltransferase
MDENTQAELARLRQDVAQLAKRLDDTTRLLTATQAEQTGLLRRLAASSTIYLGDHVAMTFLSNGARAFVDTRDRAVGIHLLHGGSWERQYTDAFERLLRPGATVLDVGANLGWYTLISAPIVGPTGRVFAVEPNPELARLVYDSAQINGFGRWVSVFQVAVNDVRGVVDLVFNQHSPGGGQIRPAEFALGRARPASTRVAALPIDEILAEHKGPVDVVKMDIEGWEGMALRGMKAVLDRSPGLRMMLEWSPARDRTPAPRSETAAMLSGRGYTPFRIGLKGALLRSDWPSVVAEKAMVNLVVLPAGDPLAEG